MTYLLPLSPNELAIDHLEPILTHWLYLSCLMTKPTILPVRPAKTDQPGHPPSLIRVFVVGMKKAWVLSHPLSAQRRLRSDRANALGDLRLRWAHSHFVGLSWGSSSLMCMRAHTLSEQPWPGTLGNIFMFLLCSYPITLTEPRHQKTCLCPMRTTKAQTSLHICPVWSAPLLFAAWIV